MPAFSPPPLDKLEDDEKRFRPPPLDSIEEEPFQPPPVTSREGLGSNEIANSIAQKAIEAAAGRGEYNAGAVKAFTRGAIKGSVGVGAGAALAGSLETPNAAISAFTGPFAPVTFASLNVLEFLGGMLLGNKLADKGEEALAAHSEIIRDAQKAAAEHPLAAMAGEQLPMLPFVARSAKGFYDIAKNAETASTAAKEIGKRVIGGGVAGAGAETLRPQLEQGFNLLGERLGLSPDEIQQPSVRSYLENIAIGAALAGETARKRKISAKGGEQYARPETEIQTETARFAPVERAAEGAAQTGVVPQGPEIRGSEGIGPVQGYETEIRSGIEGRAERPEGAGTEIAPSRGETEIRAGEESGLAGTTVPQTFKSFAELPPEVARPAVDPEAVARANEEALAAIRSQSRPARERTEEEQARAEYEAELMAEAEGAQAETGLEFLKAVIKAGGLPAKSSPHRAAYSRELALLDEMARDPHRVEKLQVNKLFSATAPPVDVLARNLRDEGFDLQRPDDVLALTDHRLRTGKQIYGIPELAQVFDLPKLRRGEKGTGDLFQTEDQPFSLAGEQGIDYEARQRQAEAAARAKAEADAAQSRQQTELFDPKAPAANLHRLSIIDSQIADLEGRLSKAGGDEQLRRQLESAVESAHARRRAVELKLWRGLSGPQATEMLAEVGAPIPATAAPPVPAGVTMVMDGRLPVTMGRTKPGSVSAPEVMDALKRVMTIAGSVGEIRRGRFANMARGIFKPVPEVVRLEHIDNVPTAVHETGHALMKQLYGTVKSSGLKTLPTGVRRELIGLGKALYGARKPTAGYTAEGFSEFIRHYLTTEDAGKVAPATLKLFEQQLLPQHPEVAQQLQAARSLIDVYRHQGAIERANRQIVRDPGWTRRTLKAFRDLVSFQKIAESGAPLRELSAEAAKRAGKPLRPSADPFKLFKMKRGSAGAIIERMVNDNMVDVWGNPVGPSLKEAFAEVRGQRNEFLLYLFGRRAEERWARGLNPGITREDATYIRSTLETQAFDRAASKYYQWWDGVLNYLVQADPTLADAVARIKKGSSDYAPLARMLDETAVRREAALAQSNPLYRMHGSGLPVKDIFDQTMMSAARLVNRANRALVSNAVVKLARIEGMGRVIEEVPRERVRKQFNVEQIRRDLEDMGIDTTALPEDTMLEYYTPADQPKGSDPVISVKHADGSTHWYYVEPRLYDTLNKLEPFGFRSIPHVGFALDFVLGAPKRLFTLGTTGLRPTFSLVTNPLRDPQGWLLQTKAGINPAKMAAAYFEAAGRQIWAAFGGKESPLANAAYNLGAHMAQPLGRDIQHTRRVSNELFHGRFMRTVLNPIDHVRQLLSVPESFPRVAEVRRVADEIGWKPGTSMSPDQAVELALAFKEATVDFSASGDVSRIVNEAVPFFNPNIQGVRTAARAFKNHPLRTTLVGLAGFTAPALLLWWKNKDKDWYRNLPWRERYYYTNIDDGKNVWQIPRAFEWGNLFGVMPEAALDSWYRQDPEAAKQALTHLFETQNPLDYPVVLRVAKEQWQNRIDFWDRPIVPRSEVDLAPGAQVGPYTTKLARWLGEAFPKQVSPRRVDAAVRGYFGGAVPDVLDAIGLGAAKSTRETQLSDIPILGRLWRRGGYYNAQSQHLADFWDIKQNLDARVGAMRLQLRDPSRQQTIPISRRDMAMAPLFDSAGQNITAALHIANQLKESEGRRRIYKFAADEARAIVDLWKKQEQALKAAENR